jgi:hypothetical protein
MQNPRLLILICASRPTRTYSAYTEHAKSLRKKSRSNIRVVENYPRRMTEVNPVEKGEPQMLCDEQKQRGNPLNLELPLLFLWCGDADPILASLERDAENDQGVSFTSFANSCHFRSSPIGILEHHGNACIVITLELH